MEESILYLLVLCYLLCSIGFTIDFYRNDTFYSPKLKLLHALIIWIIPVAWYFLLRAMRHDTPGSSHYSALRREKGLEPVEGDSPFHESGKGF